MRGAAVVVLALSVLAILVGAPGEPGVPADPGAAAQTSAPAPPSPEDLQALLHEAQRVQRADAVAWAGYRFRRTARAERLAQDGTVEQASLLEFEVMPAVDGNGFDERLVAIDGRPPTAQEIETQRGSASFTRHYRTLTAGKDEQDVESGYSLSTLLRLAEYHYVGIEDIDGVPAHRLDFEPAPAGGGGSIAARITQAMSGSLWLTLDGLHLVRARASTTRPVNLFLGLSKVRSLAVGLETERVAPDVYLPRELTIVTHARVFFAAIHRRRVFTYFDFVAP